MVDHSFRAGIRVRRVLGSGALLAAVALVGFGASSFASGGETQGRVIVLGFDGADARTIQAMMADGKLPHLKELADQGTFAPLGTVDPAESPTAWAALNCGQNPGKTGVPGFVKRELSVESKLPRPTPGHLRGPEDTAIESFAHTPIPTWSPLSTGAIAGVAVFVGFFVLLGVLLRVRKGVSFALALVLGGIAVWGGMALRNDLPSRLPVWKNPLAATPFWETAAKAGVKCVVLDAAEDFDRALVPNSKVLFGLGYPDARGDINSFFVYTTDELYFERQPESPKNDTGSGGHKFKVDERDGVIESQIYGPPNYCEIDRLQRRIDAIKEERAKPTTGYKRSIELNNELKVLEGEGEDEGEISKARSDEARVALPLRVEKKNGKATVTIGHESQELAEGQWSDWFHLTFDLNPLIKVRAVTRAKITHLDKPFFELYVDTVQYDPARPPFWQPLSQPEEFCSDLAHASGTYESIGWACMNLPLKDEVVDPISFMQDIEFTESWRERLTYEQLAKGDWRMLMSCMSTPDRVQHMLYQFYDPTHPMYDAKKAAQTFTFYGETVSLADAIPATYRHLDKIVGNVMEKYLKPGDTLIVCGDHGFQSFRRQVALNNWLLENGYLALKGPLTSTGDGKLLDNYVDWSKTKAYALGLGGIYVNLKGREGHGIVEKSEMDALLAEIRSKLVASVDPKDGKPFVKDAYKVSEIHSGDFMQNEADMLVGFEAGWRVSWNTTGGGLSVIKKDDGMFAAAPVCTDNNKNWSGDHVSVDPSIVPCVFFSNRKVAIPADGVSLLHVAPTVLGALGVPVPKEYDKPALAIQ